MSFDDVFVSYAHIDNLPPMPGKDGWISCFHQAIEIRVAQLLGSRSKFWRDPKLQGNDVFADTLVDKLREVALLVSIVSSAYINSEWCRKDRSGEQNQGYNYQELSLVEVDKLCAKGKRYSTENKQSAGFDK